jgi:hypothetical protein
MNVGQYQVYESSILRGMSLLIPTYLAYCYLTWFWDRRREAEARSDLGIDKQCFKACGFLIFARTLTVHCFLLLLTISTLVPTLYNEQHFLSLTILMVIWTRTSGMICHGLTCSMISEAKGILEKMNDRIPIVALASRLYGTVITYI